MSIRSVLAGTVGLREHLSANDQQLLGYTMVAHALNHGVMLSIPLFVPIWIREFSVGEAEIGVAVFAIRRLGGSR